MMKMEYTLGTYPKIDDIAICLIEAGYPADKAGAKSSLFISVANSLLRKVADPKVAASSFVVPGRIEVLGKHTDYAGGRSMVAATDQGFCMVAAGRQDQKITLLDVRTGQDAGFNLDSEIAAISGHWSNYSRTVAQRIAVNFPGDLSGADIAFWSDLPPASGMSSSSAMLVGIFQALSEVNELPSRDEYRNNIKSFEDLAAYLSSIENGSSFGTLEGGSGVGTKGGSEDHTAILCSESGRLSTFLYNPVRLERRISFPENYTFAVASSGVIAEKTGDAMLKYNNASALARKAVSIWNRKSGEERQHPAEIVEAVGGDRFLKVLSESGDETICKRIEQFILESNEILPAAAEALDIGDLSGFGDQVERSQQLAEEKLGNQVEETIFLAKAARDAGAVTASAFGAGFGGSVWAMCNKESAEGFLSEWERRYRKKFPALSSNSRFFTTSPGPSAFKF